MHFLQIPVWTCFLVLSICLQAVWAQPSLTILYTANSWGHYKGTQA
jgi:hypothetical protein